ncbi:MAG TPA: hypothetical protein VLM11_07450 [Streptosporangiaceae bacterium]|nr:hypothetical protein [Streptosporangiaceae bacterium]
MKRAFTRRGLRATLTLAALGTAGATILGTSAFAAASTAAPPSRACVSKGSLPTHVKHISGIVLAAPVTACPQNLPSHSIRKSGDAARGTPPLIWHGGAVMGTKVTGALVVTPIFWNPAGHSMTTPYKNILTRYLTDVAKASGSDTNVYSIAREYFGTDGQIRYQVKLGTPINDTNPLPADGCTVDSKDTTNIYGDNTGYNACLDDNQIIAETQNVVAANHLRRDFAHIYVIYLPKHVESCFLPGSTTDASQGQACTINYQPTAAYCAYHSFVPALAGKNLVYANMPYPIYNSKVGFTCASNGKRGFPVLETPNGNADADTEISPTSHEIIEAMTDPDTSSGWYDQPLGFEIGDECAYVYGAAHGKVGHLYNQVINGHHYLTQEEFSNHSYFASGGGCLQGE